MVQAKLNVVVVTGAAGIGEAVARRLAPGRGLVLADAKADQFAGVTGHDYETRTLITRIPTAGGRSPHPFKGGYLGSERSRCDPRLIERFSEFVRAERQGRFKRHGAKMDGLEQSRFDNLGPHTR